MNECWWNGGKEPVWCQGHNSPWTVADEYCDKVAETVTAEELGYCGA